MEKVEQVVGTAVPLDRSNIDTDQIIPAVWMKRIERTGYEDGLFQKLRRDPEFVLNQPERAGAAILVSGPNFGCGSSREHAPWALRDYGFKAIIAPSFADIFRNNLPNVGLVPATVEEKVCRQILEAVTTDPSAIVEVDVVNRTVSCEVAGVKDSSFYIDDGAAYRLANGKDFIDLALDHEAAIVRHEKSRPFWMPRSNGSVAVPFELSGIEPPDLQPV